MLYLRSKSRIYDLNTLVVIGRGVGESDISRSKGRDENEGYGISYTEGGGFTNLGEDDEWIMLVPTFEADYMLHGILFYFIRIIDALT